MSSRAGASQKTARKAPYGLSFTIADLMRLRVWAERSNLCMAVSLDQVMDGAEFEEMVVAFSAGGKRRAATFWTTGTSVFVQVPHTRPRGYASLEQALESVRLQAPRRTAWRLF